MNITFDDYADRMAPQYQVVVYHHFENGFDEKLDYQTLEEAESRTGLCGRHNGKRWLCV